MNNLEKLKQIIKEAVPEIMELKTGCRFYFPNGADCMIAYRYDKYTEFYCYWPKIGWKFDSLRNKHLEDIKILGRPITLEDVLRAIGKLDKYNPKNTSEFIAIDCNGEWSNEKTQSLNGGIFKILGNGVNSWQLGLPLDQQPQETINFLLEVLNS